MIIGGGQNLYTSLANRSVTEVGIDSLIREPPTAKWLRITGGELDTRNSSYSSMLGAGAVTEMYVPLVPPGTDSEKATIHVLVLTKDAELLAFTNQARELEKNKATDEVMQAFILRNVDKLHPARTVEGLVKFGIESSSKDEDKMRELYSNLDPKVVLLEEGAKPSLGFGLAMFTGGLLLGGFLIGRARKKASPGLPAGPPATPPPEP
jgi:hypothetical protein